MQDSGIEMQHSVIVASSEKDEITNESLGDCLSDLTDSEVPAKSVIEMDKMITKEFGIFVQCLQKSGALLFS